MAVRPILERLAEKGDSCPATPERKVVNTDEPVISAPELVEQRQSGSRTAPHFPAETVKGQTHGGT